MSKQPRDPWSVVCDMEYDVQAVIDFADALALLDFEDEDEVRVVRRLAHAIIDRQRAVEKRRAVLFRSLHPNFPSVVVDIATAKPH